MQLINTPYSVNSKFHYSPAVIHDGLLYISGHLPINYEAGETLPRGGVKEQTRQALKNFAATLELCSSSKEKVLKTTVYIPDIAYWLVINDIYAEFFGDHKPSRTIVPTNNLHFNALIEIEAIAYI